MDKYIIMKLQEKLRILEKRIQDGEQCQAIIDRIFEIQLMLDNIYYIN